MPGKFPNLRFTTLKFLLLFAAAQTQGSAGELSPAPPAALTGPGTNFLGLTTNGPAWFWSYSYNHNLLTPNPHYPRPDTPPLDTNRLPPAVSKRLLELRRDQFRTNVLSLTNSVFCRFAPESLNYLLWTNFTAHTNGREMSLWSTRVHPPGWPTNPPTVSWNHRGQLWGTTGLTALSPCWQQEGVSGQAPITLLTRRHGYTRGHGMGVEGFRTNYKGKKVWFLATNNVLVTAIISREVVRTSGKGDYTVVLFSKDMPDSITPLGVVDPAALHEKARFVDEAPWPAFYTEQGGTLGTMVRGFPGPAFKPGDSGSANLLFLPGELVFLGGRGTASASRAMQEDMDELCRLEGLNPGRYQMRWVDFSQYPAYKF